jgi:hypothetical protein
VRTADDLRAYTVYDRWVSAAQFHAATTFLYGADDSPFRPPSVAHVLDLTFRGVLRLWIGATATSCIPHFFSNLLGAKEV